MDINNNNNNKVCNPNKINKITIQETEKKIVEKDLKLNNSNNTEAFYSERYGWSLRKVTIT